MLYDGYNLSYIRIMIDNMLGFDSMHERVLGKQVIGLGFWFMILCGNYSVFLMIAWKFWLI